MLVLDIKKKLRNGELNSGPPRAERSSDRRKF
jgi:hypothetical protein